MTKGNCFLAFLSTLMTFGCAGGLRVEPVATAANPPGNVAVFLSVERKEGAVAGLTPQSFKITEDGQALTLEQTQQTLLPPDSVATHRALLLVDMSGPVTEGELRQKIAAAAARFVTKAHRTQDVSVYAFDGGLSIRKVADYAKGEDEVTDVPPLASFTPSDPSSNLNSGIVEAIQELDTRLASSQKPIRIGSLAVFARGPDLAGRVPEDKMRDAVNSTKHHVFAIGVKDNASFSASHLGRDGSFDAPSLTALDGAFDEAGTRVAETVGRYYLLSYCSPARAGMRQLRVEVSATDEKGKEIRGTLHAEFDASGFASGCNPQQTPRFSGEAAPPPEPAAEEKKDASKDAAPKHRAPAAKRAPASPPAANPKPAAPAPAPASDEVVPPPAKDGYAQ